MENIDLISFLRCLSQKVSIGWFIVELCSETLHVVVHRNGVYQTAEYTHGFIDWKDIPHNKLTKKGTNGFVIL